MLSISPSFQSSIHKFVAVNSHATLQPTTLRTLDICFFTLTTSLLPIAAAPVVDPSSYAVNLDVRALHQAAFPANIVTATCSYRHHFYWHPHAGAVRQKFGVTCALIPFLAIYTGSGNLCNSIRTFSIPAFIFSSSHLSIAFALWRCFMTSHPFRKCNVDLEMQCPAASYDFSDNASQVLGLVSVAGR